MALSARQKKGVGYGVTAVLFAGASAVLLIFSVTPVWVPVVLDILVVVAGILGIAVSAKPEV